MNILSVREVIEEIYKDFTDKRNMYKIEIDNYSAEIEILDRSIEYSSRMEDTSKLFSPRTSENVIDSIEDLKLKLETTERLLEESKEKFDYYNNYYEKLKPIVENELKPDINDIIYGDKEIEDDMVPAISKENDVEDAVTYNLNLNYDMDGTKEKLTSISHKIDTCLKIFDSDTDRAKQEIKNIGRTIDNLLKTYD
ncbi:MAG: hypothetical protein IJT80_03035 [Lachnospiraceae bacterium]|nr:hypothetical protein [Lachnospiraceae bacterium]